ncbi:non-SMC mitotic condensation complex subunit 1-domain-containing protein [Suillus bovinus]|uniref:non-SMC mitotic condensation complex subunit 1-domain-containing protein n=1 Tax=Suillus bovinus TaxID=48563 RepID=UPI001B86E1C6|nr:non-SMC mitotic condensation complex subunit 1-domain-containing protein [Suillus bovinus]KAG2156915.1 non-SMC mitotic condensation complex subunit 1-domain-containing protein [Suillus bovinus]
MSASFELQDELQALQDIANYEIPNEQDPNSNDPGPLLQQAVGAIAHSSEEITDPEIFDIFRSLLKHSDAVAGPYMSKMLDALLSAFGAQIDAAIRDSKEEDQQIVMAHKLPLEMYAFLVNWFVSAAEKVKATGEEDAPPAPVKARRGRGGKAGTSRAAAAKKAEQWTWIDQIPGTLELICKALKLKTHRIWVTSPERDAFITCLTRPAYHVAESEQYMKIQNVRMHVYKVICLAVKHHGHTLAAQINIMQSLQYYEHLSEPMAECLSILAKEFDHAQLGDEILREIAGKSFSAQDTKGPRAFSRFLVKFSEESPRSVLKQISLLIDHLDSESYPMRMAIVEVIGSLIRELATSEDMTNRTNGSNQAGKELDNLFELLLSRTLDLSSYVRSKVFATLSKMLDLPLRLPEQRLRITRAAVNTLEDKASTVRKAAVSILVKLILTHPYGEMYGGDLSLEKWEERYKTWKDKLEEMEGGIGKAVERDQDDREEVESNVEEEDADEDEDAEMEGTDVNDDGDALSDNPKPKKKRASRKSTVDVTAIVSEQEALAALETNEILAMNLRKKYCTEALDFIRTLEGGMVSLTQLLGSTNKAEVLESMEFFRVAFEYQLASAEKGIKRMLHLIWHKDNSSTSEDGKELKGVRSRLLECYRMLYLDPLPDMEPKQQVNRIAKNMIELTYDATLAELTSLEEMMRIMMEDGQIHHDVINKLWQVYSAPQALPRSQRRGAIIILGMLALSKRTIVSEKVDTLLKIGLGPFGKADLTLARYTCLALQRLNGSAKKVKGSLLDKSLRMEMENPIFRKLQNTIEHPCRSKDWFGMAEQAINTIYALGEHPDELCNNLVKNLTRRAFTKQQTPEGPPTEPDTETMEVDQEIEPPEPASIAPSSTHISTQQSSTSEKDLGDVFHLSQLLFVVGHVAIKHIVFLELVEREWKRQKDEKQLVEKLAAGGSRLKSLTKLLAMQRTRLVNGIAAVRETELLYGEQSLLKLYGPLLVHVCGSPHKFKNRTLRAAATLSFSKFLCVSSQFCDQHHHLLFKILETSRDPNIRSNIVIALGDVAVSFSNIIDENSNELYKGLSDEDLVVKKNTLMVLTHLILNGMIKVKGQLGEMAKCLEDEELRISDLAKLFFTELSTKDNAIYNNLPDVISHLSTGDHAVEEETFKSTMRYIFSFIEKAAENIVEKLCQRFRLSEDPRQWRDIAFCLSLLPFKSERSVKKLIEGLQFYRDKLHEEGVFDKFSDILTKARSNKSANKPDTELNEFESILNEHRRQGEEDQAFEKRVEGKKAAAKRKATRRSVRKKAVEAEPEPASQAPATRDDDDMYV